MSPEPTISAELREVLRDVARDREARLLRVPEELAVSAVLQTRVDVSPHATGLRPSERQLLRVHRDELAFLLRQACVIQLTSHPKFSTYAIRQVELHRRLEVPEPTRWTRHVRDIAESGRDSRDESIASATDLLIRCVAADGLSLPSVAQLAAASLRLQPTLQARIYPGNAAALAGEHALASRLFEALRDAPGPATLRAIAWTGRSQSCAAAGDLRSALFAVRRACELDSARLSATLARFCLACRVGNEREALSAAEHIDSSLSPGHPAVREFVASQQGSHELAAVRSGRTTARAFADRLPLRATSQEIANVL